MAEAETLDAEGLAVTVRVEAAGEDRPSLCKPPFKEPFKGTVRVDGMGEEGLLCLPLCKALC